MKRLNGWERLLVVFSAPVVLGWISFAAFTYPAKDEPQYSSACWDSGIKELRITPQQASSLLSSKKEVPKPSGDGPRSTYRDKVADAGLIWDDCAQSLKLIASGEAREKQRIQWWEGFKISGLVIAGSIACLYAFGFGVGWVWRGFKPTK